MASEIQERTLRLLRRFELLREQYQLIIKRKDELEVRVTMLEEQVESLNRELIQKQETIELLHAARAVAPTRDELERSKTILNNLVREVSKCITDLTQ